MRYAMVTGGKVANIVEASALAIPDFHPIPNGLPVAIGWSFAEGVFVAPASVEAPRSFTPLELIGPGGLLTDAERAAIVVAATTNPAVNLWLLTMTAADRIEVTDPRTIAGFDFAVAAGLLTAERVAEILT
jgi:hypothetical protein